MVKSWVITCVLNLFIAGIMGFLLRISQLYHFEFPYSNFLHAHSHVAILGWLYLSSYTLIYAKFIPKNKQNYSVYNRTFWITQFSVIGMMISFPIQGYALFSIIFSTLHVFCSYYFCRITWKNLPSSPGSYDVLFLKTALLFMLISTLGVWSLGIIIPTAGKNSTLYSIAIEFFLHFQLNGWFFFALLALLLNRIKSSASGKNISLFYRLSVLTVILTFAHSLSWNIPSWGLYLTNSLGILIQISALFLFFKYIHPSLKESFAEKSKIAKYLYSAFILFYSLKVLFQLFLLFPRFAENIHSIRNLTIGFIHLIVLGMYSLLLLAFIIEEKSLINPNNKIIQTGIILFILTFILSESLLFLQGILIYGEKGIIPAYFPLVSWISIGYPAGILFLLIGIVQPKKQISNK